MRRRRPSPSQAWRTILTNHADQIMAADFFVVPTMTFRLLFVLVILAHDRRRIGSRDGLIPGTGRLRYSVADSFG